jgi:phage terminase large subunit-like protein
MYRRVVPEKEGRLTDIHGDMLMIVKSNGFLEEYYRQAKTGEALIGQELMMELETLIDDMNSEDYIYDTGKADDRIDFIENCVKLTKSPFYGKQMKLMLFQKAFISALYGFKMLDGNDRYKKALFLISRKNGKSELCSALGLAEFILGNGGSDIVCSSNDDTQASILYDAMDLMRQMIDPNDLDTKKNQRFILNKVTNTKIFKMSERTRNKEGRNIDIAFQDESHELKSNTIPKSIEQSQSLKINPKFINLTTEGFVNEGYLDDELKKARAIIKGEDDSISAMRYLPWLYTQDSEQEVFQNRKSWVKSNPTLGIVKRWDYLDEQVDLAKKSKSDRIFVLSKDFNIKQNEVASWLDIEDYCYPATFDIEDLRGSFCLGHVDLAETTDLCCAKALVMKSNDPTKYILTQYFIPQRKLELENDDHEAGAKYKEWVKGGYITLCEGNDLDLSLPAEWFYKLQKEHGIKLYKCGYDQRFAKDWLAAMDAYGWSKQYGDVEMILQNAQTLSNAISLVEAELKAKLINYNENPVDRWCFSNSCLEVNDMRQSLIVKTDNAKKIDGSVTLASLYELYRRYRSDLKKLVGGNN